MKYKHSLAVDKKAMLVKTIKAIAPSGNISRVLATVLLSLIVSVVSLYIVGVRISYDVMHGDEKVAHIENIDVYNTAKEITLGGIVTENHDEIELAEFVIKPVLSFKTEKTTAEVLSNSILERTTSISPSFAVMLNDSQKLYVTDREYVEQLVNQRLDSFNIEGTQSESKLLDKLDFKTVYSDKALLSTDEDIKNFVNGLNVVTTATKVTTYEIPYKTVYKETSSKYQGYSAVTTTGVNGVNKVITITNYLNGVVSEEPTVTDVCVTQVVDKVITTGTAVKPSPTFKAPVALSDFVWPINAPWRITSYWGDGRGHKGLDIGRSLSVDSIHGADILATKAGTITMSRWNGGYGYMVEIDHGNGVKSRYAHCSKLLYKEGTYVKKGQVIAKVGSSGNSSGPHLHFEILINGTQVNPEKYFALR